MMRRLLTLSCLLLAGCGQGGSDDPWQVIDLGTDAEFRDIFFLDAQNGWMVGGVGVSVPGGIVARTTDGGQTWRYKTGVIPNRYQTMNINMNAVYFTDLQHGVVAAEAGRIMRTEDGGETWKMVGAPGPVYARNHDVDFVDAMNGWIIGREGVRRTEDGGATWARIDEERKLEGNAIQFLDQDRGWVAGKFGAVSRTVDGGVTWATVAAYGSLDGLSGDDKPNFQSLHFVDENHGWIAGYRSEFPALEQYHYAVMLHTSDGGQTWARQMEGVPVRIRAVRFADSQRGWAVGYDIHSGTSTVFATADGGLNWISQKTVFGEEFLTIFERDGQVWIAGDRVREEPQRLLRLVPVAENAE
jgi:photosystem II stability/assembly factor-like uncharacterized protein